MLSHCSSEDCNMALVAKIDRVARDLMMQLWIEKELLKNDVELVSVAEPFRGQDSATVLFRQIIGAFAQFEKARITERLSGGRKQKARNGGYAGGGPAFGYKTVRGSKELHLDEERAKSVIRAFELRDNEGIKRLQTIADRLNEEGHRTARGALFRPTQVKRILANRKLYQGLYEYSGVEAEGKHEAII